MAEVATATRTTIEVSSIKTDLDSSAWRPWWSSPKSHSGPLDWWFVCILTITFSTAGGVVIMPFAFGVCGAALGSLLLIGWASVVTYSNAWVAQLALKCGAKTFGDVGDYVAGKKGRIVCDLVQIGNLIVYVPVALLTSALALQYLTADDPVTGCLGVWTVVCWIINLVLSQFIRTFDHGKYLTIMSFVFLLAKCLVILPYVLITTDNPLVSEDVLAVGQPATLTWVLFAEAIGSFAFCLCPVFMLVETMDEMRHPPDIFKALYIAMTAMTGLYILVGLLGVFEWGYNINAPMTVGIERTAASVAANLFLFLATTNDGVLTCTTLFKCVRQQYLTSFVFVGYSPVTMARYLLFTMPYFLFALAFATCIPSFETLVGFVSSLTIVTADSAVPAGLILVFRQGARAATTSYLLPAATLVVGLALALYIFAATCKEVSELTFGHFEDMFCGVTPVTVGPNGTYYYSYGG